MYTTSEIIKAGRITNVMTFEDFNQWRREQKEEVFFSIFPMPKAGVTELGDVIEIRAKLPHNDGTRVPVVVGDWSPIVFLYIDKTILEQGIIDQIYVAPIDGRDVVVK